MTTLENLWYGNYEFTENLAESDKEYFTAVNDIVKLEDSLRQVASEATMEIFNEIGEKQLVLSAVGAKVAFVCGVRFGVQFILDALGKSA